MLEISDQGLSVLRPPRTALMLRGRDTTAEDRNLARILDFFRIRWKSVTACDGGLDEHKGEYAILSSAACLAEAMQEADTAGAALPPWMARASTVYVHGFQDDDPSTKLLRRLTTDPQAKVIPLPAGEITITVAEDLPEMCGPMLGMRVSATLREPGCTCDVRRRGETLQSVIRADQGDVFFGVSYKGVPFFLNTWSKVIDIDAPALSFFDVRKCFCEAVPIVLYLSWMFPGRTSRLAETNACLIVDDPRSNADTGFWISVKH
jgi:hypothetical protein